MPGPLLPVPTTGEMVNVHLHAIVDGPIVTAIFNNRTAVTSRAQPDLEADTAVRIFGPAPQGQLQTWELMGTKQEKLPVNTKSSEIWL